MFIEHRSGYRPTSEATLLDDLRDVLRRGGYTVNVWRDGQFAGSAFKRRDGRVSFRWVAQEIAHELRETQSPITLTLIEVVRARCASDPSWDPDRKHLCEENLMRPGYGLSEHPFWHLLRLPIASVYHDPAADDDPKTEAYIRQRRSGSPFPAILAMPSRKYPGTWWAHDGNHRVAAAKAVGDEFIDAYVPAESVEGPATSRRHLTDTQLDVLRLIAEGRHLGDYVPRYRPGARRGRGAFPMTIASRAAAQLARMGLVGRAPSDSGYVLTQAGVDELPLNRMDPHT
jgi:hypothetical protein